MPSPSSKTWQATLTKGGLFFFDGFWYCGQIY